MADLVPSKRVQTAPASCAVGPKNLPSIVPVAVGAIDQVVLGLSVTRVSPLNRLPEIVALKTTSFHFVSTFSSTHVGGAVRDSEPASKRVPKFAVNVAVPLSGTSPHLHGPAPVPGEA